MNPKIVTIGVYGFTEHKFFQRLLDAGVDVFCDIRARRGVRGPRYAFANSKRLQARLAEFGIRYIHVKDLAPTTEAREEQHHADARSGVGKRARRMLDPRFVEAYTKASLSDFDARAFLEDVNGGANVIALFCVEHDPKACHRSIVAERLREALALEVEHLVT